MDQERRPISSCLTTGGTSPRLAATVAVLLLACAPVAFGSEVAVGESGAERSLLQMLAPMFRIVAISMSPLLLVVFWGAAVATLAWLQGNSLRDSRAPFMRIGVRRVGAALFVLGIATLGYAYLSPPGTGSLLGFLLQVVPVVFVISTWIGVAVGKIAQHMGARA